MMTRRARPAGTRQLAFVASKPLPDYVEDMGRRADRMRVEAVEKGNDPQGLAGLPVRECRSAERREPHLDETTIVGVRQELDKADSRDGAHERVRRLTRRAHRAADVGNRETVARALERTE